MFGMAMRDGLHSIQNLSADDLLGVLGLEKRRTTADILLPSLALFAAGAAVGAAAAILFAPKSGEALRRDLSAGARDLGHRLGATAQAVQEYVGANRNTAANSTANSSAT